MAHHRYNALAKELRLLRDRVEGWPHDGAPTVPIPTCSYKQRYMAAQWRVHKDHLRNCHVTGHPVRNSGEALSHARSHLSRRAYNRQRNAKRTADRLRHVSYANWEADGVSSCSDSTSSTELSFGYRGELNHNATEFFPANSIVSNLSADASVFETAVEQLLPDYLPGLPFEVDEQDGYDLMQDTDSNDFWSRLELVERLAAFSAEKIEAAIKTEEVHALKIEAHVRNLRGDIEQFGLLLAAFLPDAGILTVVDVQAALGAAITAFYEKRKEQMDSQLVEITELTARVNSLAEQGSLQSLATHFVTEDSIGPFVQTCISSNNEMFHEGISSLKASFGKRLDDLTHTIEKRFSSARSVAQDAFNSSQASIQKIVNDMASHMSSQFEAIHNDLQAVSDECERLGVAIKTPPQNHNNAPPIHDLTQLKQELGEYKSCADQLDDVRLQLEEVRSHYCDVHNYLDRLEKQQNIISSNIQTRMESELSALGSRLPQNCDIQEELDRFDRNLTTLASNDQQLSHRITTLPETLVPAVLQQCSQAITAGLTAGFKGFEERIQALEKRG